MAGYDSYLLKEDGSAFKILLEDGSGWIILEQGVPSGVETASAWSNKLAEVALSPSDEVEMNPVAAFHRALKSG